MEKAQQIFKALTISELLGYNAKIYTPYISEAGVDQAPSNPKTRYKAQTVGTVTLKTFLKF